MVKLTVELEVEKSANTPLKSPPLKVPSAEFWKTKSATTFLLAVINTPLPLDESPPKFAKKLDPVLELLSRISNAWYPPADASPVYSNFRAPATSICIVFPFTKLTRVAWYLDVESIMSPPTFRNLNVEAELSLANLNCLTDLPSYI